MKRKLVLIATGLVATASLAIVSGCSSFMQGFKEGWNQSKYTEAMKTTFMVNCTPEAEKNVSADEARTYCECVFERVSSTIPVAEYARVDSGQPARDETTAAFRAAVSECGGNPDNI